LTAQDPRGAALAGDAGLFLDRLRARLGDQAVRGLCWVAEHRPERAYRSVPVQHLLSTRPQAISAAALPSLATRPLWLLRAPVLLTQVAGTPCYTGPLVLCEGPERIESGWWDGSGIARDYYRAHNPHGIRLWIFRTRALNGLQWFLHGFFA
jgi:protein ImuB